MHCCGRAICQAENSITARRRITTLHGVTTDDDRRSSRSEKTTKEKHRRAAAPPGAGTPTRVCLVGSAKKSTRF